MTKTQELQLKIEALQEKVLKLDELEEKIAILEEKVAILEVSKQEQPEVEVQEQVVVSEPASKNPSPVLYNVFKWLFIALQVLTIIVMVPVLVVALFALLYKMWIGTLIAIAVIVGLYILLVISLKFVSHFDGKVQEFYIGRASA